MTRSPEKPTDQRLFLASIDRTLQVLRSFEAGHEALSISEITKSTGLGRSAVQRIVYTLDQLGYLNREPDSRFYKMTIKMVDLCRGLIGPESASHQLLPLLNDLSSRTGETTSWVQRDEGEIVILQTVRSWHLGHVGFSLGQRINALSSSSGQVILAHEDPKVAEKLLEVATPEIRERLPFSTTAEMHDYFDKIIAQVYAVNAKEEDLFSVSISGPVFSQSGKVLGAITISALESRVARNTVDITLAPVIVSASKQASTLINRRERAGLVTY